MKKILILLLTCTSLYAPSVAQDYISFPETDASWKIIHCSYFFPPGLYDVITYDQSGDTLIGTESYHKIYCTFHHWPGSNYDTTYTFYYGGIRESQKQILIKSTYAYGDTIERIMYDFNAEDVGDTVVANLLNYGDPIFLKTLVSGIDSVLIDGTYHRRLSFSNIQGYPTLEKWTEGIGSNFGLMYPEFYVVTDNSYDLRCFSTAEISYQNNQLLFGYCQTPPQVPCNFATQVIAVRPPLYFSAYPNPARDHLTIHFEIPVNHAILQMYNSLGKKIITVPLPLRTDFELNLQPLQPGMYWLQLMDDRGLLEAVPFMKL